MAGPFHVTLLYTSCEREATVALDSLEFINCESGEFIGSLRAFKPDAVMVISCDKHLQPLRPDKRNQLFFFPFFLNLRYFHSSAYWSFNVSTAATGAVIYRLQLRLLMKTDSLTTCLGLLFLSHACFASECQHTKMLWCQEN